LDSELGGGGGGGSWWGVREMAGRFVQKVVALPLTPGPLQAPISRGVRKMVMNMLT
jgi:hypothetical protein